ncbi:TetR/AcrR family transcriptional regulator [Micromonospora craniellae]|uniref:TetR/AcrR family transcriptional regulator n=1 Tax=Micromonospora craniellae TaxID=2294034 RepID=A0A372G0A5_9ACTN|nr:TetR/AcrR family transcriptional regulator [Micromonospora craniellae]QOC94673.1 TetR/AcrR family transcriptional regulator [Micromonospora craniellae]RFS46462.1 TetR/AcrR family transcriptional regulator [Micromonospora craniellae]
MSATPAFKRLPRAVREQQMLDAAVRVFSRRGYHGASMDEIAEDAGISKPMVYAYLGTKEELFVACLHREGTRMMEAIAGAAVPDLPADERLWRGLRAFFGFVGAHRDGWSVLYRQARAEQPFAGELAEMRARMVEVVAGMLDHALRAEGRMAAETELEVVAYALVGATESLADWLADHPEADPEKTATRMMNAAWLGAGQLLRGVSWHPPEAV